MLRTVSLAELAAGQVIELVVGDTLHVVVNFSYTVAERTTVTLRCGLHWGGLDRVEEARNSKSITLEKALTPVSKEESVDVLIRPKAEGGVPDGTYGLIAEILETGDKEIKDDCIVVTGNPAKIGLGDIIMLAIVVMMMGIVMPMITAMKE